MANNLENFAMFIPTGFIEIKEPVKYSTIDELMNDLSEDWRYRYCEAGRCACMGCVNNELARNGFSKEDWETWVAANPDTREKSVGYEVRTYTYKK